jgi:hypothetical protein
MSAQRSMFIPTALVALVAALALAGCSTGSDPSNELAMANSAVDQAAADVKDDAAVELAKAKLKLALARQAAARGHAERAERLAEQAMVDARLAESLAEADAEKRQAQVVIADIDVVRPRHLY